MRVTVKKWGNSASIRIPVSIMEAARLHVDDAVDIREENGHVIIKPINEPKYDLENLLSGITSENLHCEVDFGQAVGRELL